MDLWCVVIEGIISLRPLPFTNMKKIEGMDLIILICRLGGKYTASGKIYDCITDKIVYRAWACIY